MGVACSLEVPAPAGSMFRKLIVVFIAAFCLLCFSGIEAFGLECINTEFLFDIRPGADQPSDLAIGTNGYIYIVDGVNNRVIAVDHNGRWKFAFGSAGSGKGQFKYPVGIDISDSGEVYIADTGNHRIQVFDQKGNYRNSFTVKSGKKDKPSDPVDVLSSTIKNYLYVSDNDHHKIRVYKKDGSFAFEWGGFGEDYGQFRYPGIMILTELNEILVVDVLNTRVQKFDPLGEFLADIGSWGVMPGNFFRPKGVAIDKKNRVFISDSYMGVIQTFSDSGRFEGVVCEKNRKKIFRTPVGIIIDKTNRLLVVEMRGNKITVMKILG